MVNSRDEGYLKLLEINGNIVEWIQVTIWTMSHESCIKIKLICYIYCIEAF